MITLVTSNNVCSVRYEAIAHKHLAQLQSEEHSMSFSFENSVALVTGAASGIGLATAQAFARLALP